MATKTKKKLPEEIENFLKAYREWYARYTSGPVANSNPTDPPPPPPGPGPK